MALRSKSTNPRPWQPPRATATPSPAARIQCSRGEWKTRDGFSKKALGRYDLMVHIGQATPSAKNITCREHTSNNQATEIQCHGPCGKWRSIDNFSKSSRRNKKYLCKDCTAWQLADPEQDLPPPGAQLSIDELTSGRDQAEDPQEFLARSGSDWDALSSYNGGFEIESDRNEELPDNFSTCSSFDSDDDDSDCSSSSVTVRAGLGSGAYSEPRGQSSFLGGLSQYSRPISSQTTNSASRYTESVSDTRSSSSSTTTSQTREEREEPVEYKKGGWAKVRKPKNWAVPDYIRNDTWDDQEETPRFQDYESDDEI